MKTVIVTSKNPIKLETTQRAFAEMFPDEEFDFVTFSADSGVSDQPKSHEETLVGARNRIAHAKQEFPEADFYIGLEGGMNKNGEEWEVTAFLVVHDRYGKEGKAHSASHPLPRGVQDLVESGLELGHATDQFFGEENTKHGPGTIGLLTDNQISRADYYVMPLIFALIPFKKSDLF